MNHAVSESVQPRKRGDSKGQSSKRKEKKISRELSAIEVQACRVPTSSKNTIDGSPISDTETHSLRLFPPVIIQAAHISSQRWH